MCSFVLLGVECQGDRAPEPFLAMSNNAIISLKFGVFSLLCCTASNALAMKHGIPPTWELPWWEPLAADFQVVGVCRDC